MKANDNGDKITWSNFPWIIDEIRNFLLISCVISRVKNWVLLGWICYVLGWTRRETFHRKSYKFIKVWRLFLSVASPRDIRYHQKKAKMKFHENWENFSTLKKVDKIVIVVVRLQRLDNFCKVFTFVTFSLLFFLDNHRRYVSYQRSTETMWNIWKCSQYFPSLVNKLHILERSDYAMRVEDSIVWVERRKCVEIRERKWFSQENFISFPSENIFFISNIRTTSIFLVSRMCLTFPSSDCWF